MRGAGLLLVLVLVACGDAAPPRHAATTTRRLPSLDARPAGGDDVQVATVDGRPVWGSCVAAQARGRALDRHAALDECIALELAAQEAQRRGLDADPDVGDEATRVLAAALVDREVSGKMTKVSDLPPALVEEVWRRNQLRQSRPEYRATYYIRIATKAAPGTAEDLAAAATMRAAHARLAGRADLFPADLDAAIAAVITPGQALEAAAHELSVPERLQPYYGNALFALTAIGQVTEPVRGPWGWDLILYTDRLPPLEQTRDQILDDLFPRMRMRWFVNWSSQLEKALGAERFYDDRSLPQLLGEEGA